MNPHWLSLAVRTSAARTLRDVPGAAVTLGFYVLVTVVLAALWRAGAQANGGTVAGYGLAAFTWYVAMSEAVTVALRVRMIEEVADDIASGAVAVELLRPAPILTVRVASAVGQALPRLALCVVAGFVLAMVVAGGPPKGAGAVLAVPSAVLAVTCNVVAQHAVAGVAFWARDARGMWFLYQKLVFILGGMLLPLQVLPGTLERAAQFTPFPAMAYAPARLASGHVEPWLLGVQVGWLVVLALLARAVFAAGQRRLQVVGG